MRVEAAGIADARCLSRAPVPSVDALIARLRSTIACGRPLEPAMAEASHSLGFEHFVYTAATLARPNRPSHAFVWTTMPWEWVIEYDRESYFAADPRVTEMAGRCTPLVWDAADYAGRDARVDSFLRAAERYGVRSGVVVPLADAGYVRLGVAFNSATSPVGCARRATIERSLDDLTRFAARFHALFVATLMDEPARPHAGQGTLSEREVQCLELAARGMTSADIGFKLDIAERTVYFHFSNIAGKLGVLNRKEAIAVAIASGIVKLAR
jgi:LuxR family quorum-sensing transcriptional regulator LasR